VKTAFIGDPQVKAHEINVKTYKGVVELNGFVDSSTMVAEATQDAEKSQAFAKSTITSRSKVGNDVVPH
jgi:osmotically-inducible protein OsmY